MIKIYFTIIFTSLYIVGLFAQIPSAYYNGTAGLSGNALKTKLHTIIRGHTKRSYSQLWTDFQKTDKKLNGKVWDMYSDIPGSTPPYEFTFGSGQCGTYSAEGDCYNREHSFPKSWWGGSTDTMYTDLFQLVPTDGYVNNKRASYPYGEVGTATWTSANGSKLGSCNYPGYTATVFEPIDDYKGDFARVYFYMATRYLSKFDSWAPNTDMLDGSGFSSWALNLLLDWHTNDPVSAKEIARNDSIYQIQGNRNPFIDHPNWVNDIWNPSASSSAPVFNTNYPQSSNITNTSFDLIVNQDKAGTAYFVVLANGASTPTATQVKNGQDASGSTVAANMKGNLNISAANTSYTASISGLSAATDYDVFVVSEDNNSPANMQSSTTLLDVQTTGSSGGGSGTTYTEGFDVGANWAGGSAGSYNAKTYTVPGTSNNDFFSASSAVRESSNVNSAPYSWRLKNANGVYLRYECEGTISSFSIYAARWDNSPKPNVTVKYSVDGGSNYTTAFSFSGDDFSGDKVYKQFSYTFPSPITNNSGSKIYIEFVTTSGERMLYDDFEVIFSSPVSSNSNESDIILKTSWNEPQNIDYKSYVISSGLTISNSIEVAKFTIRDGGNDVSDSDTESTKLTDIEFTINNYSNLASLAIFDGTTKISEINSISSSVNFSALGLEAADESTKDFSLYAGFNSSVIDNQNLQFSITSATADPAGSTFASTDAGGAATNQTGDNNKIMVNAVQLEFISNKPPVTVNMNTNFDVEVQAVDLNDNVDLDATSSVSLAVNTGTGNLSSASGLSKNLVSGVASWTDVQYDTEEDFSIDATTTGLNSATSPLITCQNQSYFSDLIISEYVEGSSNNKYLELWNNTGSTIDLSNYKIEIYFNGSNSAGNTISLSGSLLQDDVFVIEHSSATKWTGTANLSTASLAFNGNDAVVLVNTTAKGIIDIVGQIGNSNDFAKDMTLERNATATGPNSTYTSSEWDTKSTDDVSGLGTPGPLPIKLLSFVANLEGETVVLKWQTASETNNDYFSIERSMDVQNFEEIGRVAGAGNSNTIRDYSYTDNIKGSSTPMYYRLKQLDYNGTFSYSPTISIRISAQELALSQAYIQNKKLHIVIKSPSDNKLSVNLVNMSGINAMHKEVDLTEGDNEFIFSVSQLPEAVYILRLSTQNFIETKKVFIK